MDLPKEPASLDGLIENCVGMLSLPQATLLRIDPAPTHLGVILDFVYSTGDASGQNMTTFATSSACEYIMEILPKVISLKRYLIESNYSGDKTPCMRNLTKGRGHHVIAQRTYTQQNTQKSS